MSIRSSSSQTGQDGITSSSPAFNNSTLTQNIGFTAQSSQNIGFNLPVSSTATTFNTTSNNFNGTGLGFNNFSTQNNGNTAATSPLSDLDEFDIITNRGKLGASPQTVNNGKSCKLFHCCINICLRHFKLSIST